MSNNWYMVQDDGGYSAVSLSLCIGEPSWLLIPRDERDLECLTLKLRLMYIGSPRNFFVSGSIHHLGRLGHAVAA